MLVPNFQIRVVLMAHAIFDQSGARPEYGRAGVMADLGYGPKDFGKYSVMNGIANAGVIDQVSVCFGAAAVPVYLGQMFLVQGHFD